jgi:hypothetical protein
MHNLQAEMLFNWVEITVIMNYRQKMGAESPTRARSGGARTSCQNYLSGIQLVKLRKTESRRIYEY